MPFLLARIFSPTILVAYSAKDGLNPNFSYKAFIVSVDA
jgi:hypothetical protein